MNPKILTQDVQDPIKVVKFGGSSLADAEHFRMVQNIITQEASRRYVVPSAPGKRFKEDEKVTDLLYQCYEVSDDEEALKKMFARVIERYELIIEGLGLDLDLSDYEEEDLHDEDDLFDDEDDFGHDAYDSAEDDSEPADVIDDGDDE